MDLIFLKRSMQYLYSIIVFSITQGEMRMICIRGKVLYVPRYRPSLLDVRTLNIKILCVLLVKLAGD